MKYTSSFRYSQGFTLVELSIVLVILGLLVGGVLTGQSLIRASELRSITTQQTTFLTAVNAFRDKYFALPGDMNNAQSFWGVAHATPATCVTTSGTGTQTCNGDGDGLISFTAAGSNEVYRFWQHLSNAGLIEGRFSGITQGSTYYTGTTANSPAGKINGAIWQCNNSATIGPNSTIFEGVYNNTLVFGMMVTNGEPYGPVLKPEELWNIDTKMDDGKPATGKLVMRGNTIGSCTDGGSSSALTANYLLSSSTIACAAMFRNAF